MIFDCVAPCFPPNFNIFNLCLLNYHSLFEGFYRECSSGQVDLEIKDILKLLAWADTYRGQLERLGAQMEISNDCLTPLYNLYKKNVKEMLTDWIANLLESDLRAEVLCTEEGLFHTHAPTDLFRILSDQIATAEQTSTGMFYVEVINACTHITHQLFQRFVSRIRQMAVSIANPAAEPPCTYEKMCSIVNNADKMFMHMEELKERVQSSVDATCFEDLNFGDALDVFVDLARAGNSGIVAFIFRDISPILDEVFTKDWLEGDHIERVAATVQDFFVDLHANIEPHYFKKMAMETLNRIVLRYLDLLVCKKHAFESTAYTKMRDDITWLDRTFAEELRPKVVDKELEAVTQISALLSPDVLEATSVSLAVGKFFHSFPDCPLSVVERIVSSRVEIEKHDLVEILKVIKAYYEKFKAKQTGSESTIFSKLPSLASYFPTIVETSMEHRSHAPSLAEGKVGGKGSSLFSRGMRGMQEVLSGPGRSSLSSGNPPHPAPHTTLREERLSLSEEHVQVMSTNDFFS
eukprot:Rmarinus@m.11676